MDVRKYEIISSSDEDILVNTRNKFHIFISIHVLFCFLFKMLSYVTFFI